MSTPPPPPSLAALSTLTPANLESVLLATTNFLVDPSSLPLYQTAISALPNPPKEAKTIAKTLLLLLPYAATYLSPTTASLSPLSSSLPPPLQSSLLKSLPPSIESLSMHLNRGGKLPVYDAAGVGAAALGSVATNRISNLSYTFGVTAATDSLSQVGRVYLQLDLETVRADGSKKREVVETDVKGLYELIGEMERVKSMMAVVDGE